MIILYIWTDNTNGEKCMKKIFRILFSVLLSVTALFTPFLHTAMSKSASASEINLTSSTANNIDDMLSHIAITQEGYRFSKADFEFRENQYFLYVNTAITIINTTTSSNLRLSYSYENFTSQPLFITYGTSHVIAMNGPTENVVTVNLSHWSQHGSTSAIDLSFKLVQTPISFANSKPFEWKNKSDIIDAPANTVAYDRGLTLNINDDTAGTEDCPIFIDFYFNGEFYSVYKQNDTFYNNITGNVLYFEDPTSKLLTFNVPGQYEVYIYDKTSYSALKPVTIAIPDTETQKTVWAFDKNAKNYSSYANVNSCKFSIKYNTIAEGNTQELADNMYIIAQSQNNTIVSGQTVNTPVDIKFYNLDEQKIGKIEVIKSHSSLDGNVLPTTEVLFPSIYTKISDLKNSVVTYSSDSSYTIDIYDKSGNKIWENPFTFTILVDIHNAYDGLLSTDRNIVPHDNKIEPIPRTTSHTIIYKGLKEITEVIDELNVKVESLKSSMTTSYTLYLARANSSIDGIEDGIKTEGPVTLTVHGVGEITTKIYRDGNLVDTKILFDSNQITLSAVGKYKVVISDQMATNVQLVKNFTIKQTLTGATIALIVIGVVGGTVFIFMIIRTRSKIKVR